MSCMATVFSPPAPAPAPSRPLAPTTSGEKAAGARYGTSVICLQAVSNKAYPRYLFKTSRLKAKRRLPWETD